MSLPRRPRDPRHHRPLAAVGVGLVAVLALGACSSAGSGSASAGGSGASAVAPANPEIGAPDADMADPGTAAAADAQKLAESSGQSAGAVPGSAPAGRNSTTAADIAAADKLVRTASLQVQVDDVEAKASQGPADRARRRRDGRVGEQLRGADG